MSATTEGQKAADRRPRKKRSTKIVLAFFAMNVLKLMRGCSKT
jgi:hypothetical protein